VQSILTYGIIWNTISIEYMNKYSIKLKFLKNFLYVRMIENKVDFHDLTNAFRGKF